LKHFFFLYSNLFSGLWQSKVRDAVHLRQVKEVADRDMSMHIAQKYPLPPPISAFHEIKPQQTVMAKDSPNDVTMTEADVCDVRAEKRPRYDDMDSNCAKAPKLPAPLTEDVLCAAARELPAGPLAAFETCLSCWRRGRLGPSELVATARSFTAASPALRRLFASSSATPSTPMSELATPDQMRELAYLAAASAAASTSRPAVRA
jgi:hypothetical protein